MSKKRNYKKVIDGDIIIHGLLCQMWLIEKSNHGLTAKIISLDSGLGYWEYVKGLGLFLDGNNTEIIGNIKTKEFIY